MARRSVLFAPGDRPSMLRKALGVGADVVAFDLEDGVGPDRKQKAREAVAEILEAVATDDLDADGEVWVRTSPGSTVRTDLEAVLAGGVPDGLLLPKVAAADEVDRLAQTAREVLDDRDLDVPDAAGPESAWPPVVALIESAAGVLAADRIAAADATDALVFGAEDLAADLGADRTPDGEEVLYARQRVVTAARAASVDAIDTHVPDYDDDERLLTDARRARRFGYDGKLAIHPSQVPVIHEAFLPEDDAVDWARRVLEAWEDDPDAGVVTVDGEMVDAPQVTRARRILDRAAADEER